MEESLELVRQRVKDSIAVKERLLEKQAEMLVRISQGLVAVVQAGGTVYLCGNGGSAADAQHVAAELVGRYIRDRGALPAVALTTNSSILTAIGNDYDFSHIFARQVRACVTSSDAVVGISTSGKSLNVLEAVRAGREIGATTFGFTGTPGEPLASEAHVCLCVPSTHTPRIQEAHIVAWHIICELIERSV